MRIVLGLVAAAAVAGCNFSADAEEGRAQAGAGGSTTRSFEVAGFDAVSLAGPYDAIVTVGKAASVRAEGDAAMIERMEVEVRGDGLHVGTKRGLRMNWERGAKVTVYITVPSLKAAEIAGSGDMRIDAVQGASFTGEVAGSGNLAIARLAVREAEFDIAGSGNVTAAGTADTVDIDIAGSGDVDVASLRARDLKVSIAGSGNVRSFASATADVSIMGSGDVTVGGSPKCSVSKMGSGGVRCGA